MIKNVIAIIDGAAGSCGKGKVIGEVATEYNILASITNNMPNAGHTFVSESGKNYIFRNIPVSIVNKNAEAFIGPGSFIDMEDFIIEYESVKNLLGERKIYVHPMVALIEERHKEYERKNLKSGSTFKGCGAALAEKVTRNPNLKFFKGYKNAVVISADEYLEKLHKHLNNPSGYVVLEGAQGADLCLNHSDNHPYVTSRNVSAAQSLADSGISAKRLFKTIMVIRPFPIRISNITKSGEYINSGSYGNGDELTWSHINISSLMGIYPTKDMFDDISYNIDENYTIFLLNNLCDSILFEVLGPYRNINDLSVVDILELERKYNILQNKKIYQSKIIDLFNNEIIIDLSETTTVTKKERRVFDLDIKKLKNNCLINEPDYLYLNFFTQLNINYKNIIGNYDDIYFDRYIRSHLEWLEVETACNISTLGTGSKNMERIVKYKMNFN